MILHLNKWDFSGGAARATYRIHKGLRDLGVDSVMMVDRKSTLDSSVLSAATGVHEKALARMAPVLDRLPLKLYPHADDAPWGIGWLANAVSRRVSRLAPRIIHVHWIGDGFLPIGAFSRFRVPVVWSLHDPWPFTGGCHYPGTCVRYQQSCGFCPQLGSGRSWDLSRWVWSRKRRHLESLRLTVVVQSRWMWKCSRASSLFGDRRIELIPYGLDTTLYKPLDQALARNALNLPADKQIILMGALDSTTNPRKGFAYLAQATRILASRGWGSRAQLVVFGAKETSRVPDCGLKTRFVGTLHDDFSLALVYSAADVFVAPSLEEAFGLTILEAMACGTPCVGFDVGGISDMIENRRTGCLAPALNAQGLADGIAWVLQDEANRVQLGENARNKVEIEFTSQLCAKRYLSLYREILEPGYLPASVSV